ncbi:copper transport outer membrane protein MctB [Sediminihabitans luteus]|uniref:Copper transport outer membrane protein MctB n=1 Tax=Sediminihabitans luteus TaxID=1138585 RepID=A0A2M9CRH3_9CELL|nr:copper transporter [Sediminihabitans luteus]PJJ74435.1 copper transport outer membrane protein MctB [Sediminihabitans luteus]GIJ00198.1 hypothetical protein Slu03_25750 [Sediminihabitans luteus]
MIDFRYHIVSLISVFLALAVGIILGAGPLKGPIGDQLTGQVEQLRDERNQLRDELDTANGQLDDANAYVVAAGPALVDGSLEGRTVAVVGLGDLDDERYAPIAKQLDAAGATVSARVDTTETWVSQDDESFRKVVADGIADTLGSGADDSSATALSQALVIALTGADELDPTQRSADASSLQDVLVRGDLVSVVDEPTAPADVVLFVAPPAPAPEPEADADAAPTETDAPAETDDYPIDIELELPVAAAAAADSVVVAGPTLTSGDLVSRVRDDERTATTVSTVSGVGETAGQINVPLALAAGGAGEVGHYGFDDGATAVIPPAVEPDAGAEVPEGTPTEGEG